MFTKENEAKIAKYEGTRIFMTIRDASNGDQSSFVARQKNATLWKIYNETSHEYAGCVTLATGADKIPSWNSYDPDGDLISADDVTLATLEDAIQIFLIVQFDCEDLVH